MTSVSPDLSIVICTRNRAGQLRGALESLLAMKATCSWEAILVDNASTDGTADVIREVSDADPRIRYVREERVGLGAARDRGWREARSALIALTDDDCYVAEDFVDAVVTAFEGRPEVGVIGGRILLFDPEDVRVTFCERDYPLEFAPYSFAIAGDIKGANLTFRREALEAIGGFDPELGAGTRFPCEDTVAIAGVLWAGFKGRYDPRPLVLHHHRRRLPDLPRLMAGYDRGRGAYYAKFLLRPECRRTFVMGWAMEVRNHLDGVHLAQFFRELRSATVYLASLRRILPLMALTAAAPLAFATAALAVGARAVLKPKPRKAVVRP
ncbi:MAG: glycosyltransferase [Dongiaceae bacterium]